MTSNRVFTQAYHGSVDTLTQQCRAITYGANKLRKAVQDKTQDGILNQTELCDLLAELGMIPEHCTVEQAAEQLVGSSTIYKSAWHGFRHSFLSIDKEGDKYRFTTK